MNPQIEKLYKEATGKDWAYDFDPEVAEKFAELIIRECGKVISDGRFSDMACEGNSHRISYNNGRYGASSDIKKHFGVEA